MPSAWCSLADAYGSDFSKPKPPVQKRGTDPNVENNTKQNVEEENRMIEANEKRMAKYGKPADGQLYKCIHCEHCNATNNEFQQNVINQAVWPRPRWIPQSQNEVWGDPYSSRYYNEVGGKLTNRPQGAITIENLGQKPRLNPPQQNGIFPNYLGRGVVEHFGEIHYL